MKKILFIGNHDIVLYNFRKELIQKLISLNYDVYFTCPHGGEKTELLIAMGAKFIESKLDRHGMNIINDLNLIRQYKNIFKKVKPDIILSYTIKPNIYGAIAARKYKIPFIANITGLGNSLEGKSVIKKLIITLYKYAFKKVNLVFFQNEYNKNFFEINKISKEKNVLIPGSGVNLEHFKYIEYPQNGKINFAFISRIMKEKGIDEYLETAKTLNEKANFYVIGFFDGEYQSVIEAYHKENYIKYLGFSKDIREKLENIDVVVLPSYHEGMSNVLLESQASGRPVIGSNIPGVKETFVDQQSGFLVNKMDSQDLIDKVNKMISLSVDERIQMGKIGRQHVTNNFSRDLVTNIYIEKIKELVKWIYTMISLARKRKFH